MGVPYPSNSMVIDLSHWNEVTSWNDVARAGVAGVVHKFSQGPAYRDPTYADRKAAALKAGLLFGRYHFADASDVTIQVTNFLTNWDEDELLALDWEDDVGGWTMTKTQAVDFVKLVEIRTGVIPVLYSGNTLKEAVGKTADPDLARCRLWLAHYAEQPKCPPGWDVPWLWQRTDKGAVPGIKGDVDLDSFAGQLDVLVDTWAPELLS
jgi:lysozyme